MGSDILKNAMDNYGKIVDDNMKSTEILFNEDTTVIHLSGNKESIGKILKTSLGL